MLDVALGLVPLDGGGVVRGLKLPGVPDPQRRAGLLAGLRSAVQTLADV